MKPGFRLLLCSRSEDRSWNSRILGWHAGLSASFCLYTESENGREAPSQLVKSKPQHNMQSPLSPHPPFYVLHVFKMKLEGIITFNAIRLQFSTLFTHVTILVEATFLFFSYSLGAHFAKPQQCCILSRTRCEKRYNSFLHSME